MTRGRNGEVDKWRPIQHYDVMPPGGKECRLVSEDLIDLLKRAPRGRRHSYGNGTSITVIFDEDYLVIGGY